jgi:hypothetical protein
MRLDSIDEQSNDRRGAATSVLTDNLLEWPETLSGLNLARASRLSLA